MSQTIQRQPAATPFLDEAPTPIEPYTAQQVLMLATMQRRRVRRRHGVWKHEINPGQAGATPKPPPADAGPSKAKRQWTIIGRKYLATDPVVFCAGHPAIYAHTKGEARAMFAEKFGRKLVPGERVESIPLYPF